MFPAPLYRQLGGHHWNKGIFIIYEKIILEKELLYVVILMDGITLLKILLIVQMNYS